MQPSEMTGWPAAPFYWTAAALNSFAREKIPRKEIPAALDRGDFNLLSLRAYLPITISVNG
jgi:hypothetical protein